MVGHTLQQALIGSKNLKSERVLMNPKEIKVGKIYCCDIPKALLAEATKPTLEKRHISGHIKEQSPFVTLGTVIRHDTYHETFVFVVKVLTETGLVGYLCFWEGETVEEIIT